MHDESKRRVWETATRQADDLVEAAREHLDAMVRDYLDMATQDGVDPASEFFAGYSNTAYLDTRPDYPATESEYLTTRLQREHLAFRVAYRIMESFLKGEDGDDLADFAREVSGFHAMKAIRDPRTAWKEDGEPS